MSTTQSLQLLPDYYMENAERKSTNPRYRNFLQINFTAGDMQQFSEYRDYSSPTKQPHTPKENVFSEHKFNFSDLYYNIDAGCIDDTFKYMFYKFKKGIFVKIHDNQLRVFLPFSNPQYTNEWSDKIRCPPAFATMSEFLKHCSQLQGYQLRDSNINYDLSKWYANNFLLRTEYPINEGDTGVSCIKNMLESLCEKRSLPDIEFFINRRDFPVLKNDKTEPYHSIYNTPKQPLRSHCYDKYAPILSMVSRRGFADIAMPTAEDWARNCRDKQFYPPRSYDYKFNLDFKSKRPVAIFRGSSTGEATTISTNPRLKIAYLSSLERRQSDGELYLDAGITKWNTRPRKEYGNQYLTTIEHTSFPFGLVEKMSPEDQSNYKYIVNIDGHVAAFRLSLELGMGCVILLVESPYTTWYRGMLQEYIHYVPVKRDLSDLYEKIDWCRNNEEKCQKIVDNCQAFYKRYLETDGVLDYMQRLLSDLKGVSGTYRYNPDHNCFFDKMELPLDTVGIAQMCDQLIVAKNNGTEVWSCRDTPGYCIKRVGKSLDTIKEVYFGKMARDLDNFAAVEDYELRGDTVYILKKYIPGITLLEWIESKDFNYGDYISILLQINLALYSAQSLHGFVHRDLYPWNIILQVLDSPAKKKYRYINNTEIEISVNIVPYIIDYGKSSFVYEGVRRGDLFVTQITDTACLLLSSLFEVIRYRKIKPQKALYLGAFIKRDIRDLKTLKNFCQTNKKYNNMICFDSISNKKISDFVEYLIRGERSHGISRKVILEPLQEYKIPNPLPQVYLHELCRAKSRSEYPGSITDLPAFVNVWNPSYTFSYFSHTTFRYYHKILNN